MNYKNVLRANANSNSRANLHVKKPRGQKILNLHGPNYTMNRTFTIQEFVNAIKNLPSREAAGQDLLSYEHLKKNLNTVKTALMNIFNTVELSVPFDRFINLCYQHKFNKYVELCNKCNELGYHTRIIVLIIGPPGLVHNKFVNDSK